MKTGKGSIPRVMNALQNRLCSAVLRTKHRKWTRFLAGLLVIRSSLANRNFIKTAVYP
jgi:hypothetical protein